MRVRFLPNLLKHVFRPHTGDRDLERLGSQYGGWIVPSSALVPGAVCYLFGLGTDASLELALASKGAMEIHTFDPTPEAIAFARSTLKDCETITFHPLGVWSSDGTQRFFAPRKNGHVSHSILNLQRTDHFFEAECRRVITHMHSLGHTRLGLLKLDVEGAELTVLDDLLRTPLRPGVICVEFDQPCSVRHIARMVRRLRSADYALLAVDHWNYTFARPEPKTRSLHIEPETPRIS